ncbi:hypothetical protein ACET3Z_029577 [Daucus carota]
MAVLAQLILQHCPWREPSNHERLLLVQMLEIEGIYKSANGFRFGQFNLWRIDDVLAHQIEASRCRYYNLAHAVNERVLRQPSMLQAGILRDYHIIRTTTSTTTRD